MQTTVVVSKKRTHRDSGQAPNNKYFPDHLQECWPSDEEDIRSGNCSFHVDYLGRVELDASETRNPKACRDSFEKLHEEYARGELRPPSAVLWITGYELRVVEKECKKLDHPNIVRLLWWDYVPAEEDGAALLKIATELATGGDLRRMVREHYAAGALVAEATVWSCTVQLCAALQHMHDAGIMHRDIKPANIFVYNVYDCCDDGDIDCYGDEDNRTSRTLHLRWARATLKLGDFGFSKGFRSCNDTTDEANGLRSVLGSPLYMSPERLLLVDGCSGEIEHEHFGTYYADSDIWSAACCVYEMAALQAPFHLNGSLDINLMMNRVTNGFYPPIPCDMYSPQMAEFIDACMAVNRRLRPTGSSALRRARAGLVESLRRRQRPARSRSPRVKRSSQRTGLLSVPSRSTTPSSPHKGGLLVVPSRTTAQTSPKTILQDVPPRSISIQVPLIQQTNKSNVRQRPAVERLTVPQWSHLQATTAVVRKMKSPPTLSMVFK